MESSVETSQILGNCAVRHFRENYLTEFSSDYDNQTITYLLHLAKKTNCLKYVFKSGVDKNFIQHLRWLNTLASHFNCPAVFITPAPAKMDSSHFICGVLYQNQLLLINPLGLRLNKDICSILSSINKNDEQKIVNRIFLSSDIMQKDAQGQFSCGPICVELAQQLIDNVEEIKTQFFQWSQIPLEKEQSQDNLNFIKVSVANLCISDEIASMTETNANEVMPNIRARHLEQLSSLPLIHLMQDFGNLNPTEIQQNNLLNNTILNAAEQELVWTLTEDQLRLEELEKHPCYRSLYNQIHNIKEPMRQNQRLETSSVENTETRANKPIKIKKITTTQPAPSNKDTAPSNRKNFSHKAIQCAKTRVKNQSPLNTIRELFNKYPDNTTVRTACLRYLLQYQHYNADYTVKDSELLGYPLALIGPQPYPGYWRTEFIRQLAILAPWIRSYLNEFSRSFTGCKNALEEHYCITTQKSLQILRVFYAPTHHIIELNDYLNCIDKCIANQPLFEGKQAVILIKLNPYHLPNMDVVEIIKHFAAEAGTIGKLSKLINNYFMFLIGTDDVDCYLYCAGELIRNNKGKYQVTFSSLDHLFDEHVFTQFNQCGASADRIRLHQLITYKLGIPGLSFEQACKTIGIEQANQPTAATETRWQDALETLKRLVFHGDGTQLYSELIQRWHTIFFAKNPDILTFAEPLLCSQVANWLFIDATIVQLSKAYQNMCEIVMLCLDAFPHIAKQTDFSKNLLPRLAHNSAFRDIFSAAGLYDYGMAPIFDQLMQLLTRDEYKNKSAKIACLTRNYFETTQLTKMLSGCNALVIEKTRLEDLADVPDILITEIHPNNATNTTQFQNDVAGWVANKLTINPQRHLILLVDATLNHVGEKEFQAILEVLGKFLLSGQLELIGAQSLAKLYQFGADNFSGGSCFYLTKATSLANNLKFPVALTQKSAYYGLIIEHFEDLLLRYYDIIRTNTSWMYNQLKEALSDIAKGVWIEIPPYEITKRKTNYCATEVAITVDESAVYVCINFEPFFDLCHVYLQDEISKERKKDEEISKKVAKEEQGLLKQKISEPERNKKLKSLEQERRKLRSPDQILNDAKNAITKKLRGIILNLSAIRELPILAKQSFGFSLSNMSQTLSTIRFSIGAEDHELLATYIEIISHFGYALSKKVAENPHEFDIDAFSIAIMSVYKKLQLGGSAASLKTIPAYTDKYQERHIGSAQIYYDNHQLSLRMNLHEANSQGLFQQVLHEKDIGYCIGNIDCHNVAWQYDDIFKLLFHIQALNDKSLFLIDNAIGGFLEDQNLFSSDSMHLDEPSGISIEFEPAFRLIAKDGTCYNSNQVFIRSNELVKVFGSVDPRLSKLDTNTLDKVYTECVRNNHHIIDHPTLEGCVVLVIGSPKPCQNYLQTINNFLKERKFTSVIDWLNGLNFESLPLCHDQSWHELSTKPITALCAALTELGKILARSLNKSIYYWLFRINDSRGRRAIMRGVVLAIYYYSTQINTPLDGDTVNHLVDLFKLDECWDIIDIYQFDDWLNGLAAHLQNNPEDITRVNCYLETMMPIIERIFPHSYKLATIKSSNALRVIACHPGCYLALNAHFLSLVTDLPKMASKVTLTNQIDLLFEIVMKFPLSQEIKQSLYAAINQLPATIRIKWFKSPCFHFWPLDEFYITEIATPDDLILRAEHRQAIGDFFRQTGCAFLLLNHLEGKAISPHTFIHALNWGMYTNDSAIFEKLNQLIDVVQFNENYDFISSSTIRLVSHQGLATQLSELRFITANVNFNQLKILLDQYTPIIPKVRHGAFMGQLPKDYREIDYLIKMICQRNISVSSGLRQLVNCAEKLGRFHPLYLQVLRPP